MANEHKYHYPLPSLSVLSELTKDKQEYIMRGMTYISSVSTIKKKCKSIISNCITPGETEEGGGASQQEKPATTTTTNKDSLAYNKGNDNSIALFSHLKAVNYKDLTEFGER